jgi:uncharacterized Zn finger protein
MSVLPLSEATLRGQATPQSFERGERYYRQGRVVSAVRRGDLLRAEVEGSQYLPYRVQVRFHEGGVTEAQCSCPYDWGGWCKHIVAALLVCLHEPESVEIRPELEELLAGLDREQLQDLLLHLAAGDFDLADQIESHLALLQSAEAAPQEAALLRRTALDPRPIRRQVSAILHSLDRMRPSEAYWHVGSVVDEVRGLLDQVWASIEAGDGWNALLMLEAITDEYAESWVYLDDSDGYAGAFFADLGEVWTEAALVADLTAEEREEWAQKLTGWQEEIGDYGIDDAFDAARAALLHGWDYAPLQRALQGEITERGAWEGEAPWYADELALARLRVLEREERYQEYLNLAQAEGQVERYVTMLARLGRVEEAVEEGLKRLSSPDQTLALAQALREGEALESALRIGRHGLSLEGSKGSLAPWLSDLAAAMGESALALEAAAVAFKATPSLSAYLRVQELAGERWSEMREDLLAHLRRQSAYSVTGAQVDVFLHEGLVDDAIAAVKTGASYGQLERVMEAAIASHPDWVIRAARRQAERIIEPGKAKYYHHAVDWLDRARRAYEAAGRAAEWRTYLREIRSRHGRKYKLMGLLEKFSFKG